MGTFVVNGCHYSKPFKCIAYPLWESPHGGTFDTSPSYYQDYEEEIRKQKEKKEKQWKEYRDKRADDFFKNFFGFFGFDGESSQSRKEKSEPGYPFSVFGLKRSSSEEELKKAYRKKILKTHPDKGGSNEAFRKIQEAWECIKSKTYKKFDFM